MTNTQIKIRIQLDPSTQQTTSDSSDPESEAVSSFPANDERVYDWRKIFLTACLLLLILAGLIWFVSAMWINDEIDPLPASPEFPSLSEAPAMARIEQDIVLPESVGLQEAAQTQVNDTATEAEAAETASSDHEAISAALEEADITPAPIPQPIPMAKSAFYPDEAEMPDTISASTPQPVTAQVFRAQLTSAISRREPVDDIKQISLAGRSSRPIFLFLHLHDLAGETIQVNWFFQNQTIAQVQLPVGNHDWRTYSSKILNARRLGSWRVTAQDSSGNLLAEFPFEVAR